MNVKNIRCENGTYPTYAWPGGYPIYYIVEDGGVLCPDCVNENLELAEGDDPQWCIVAYDINYEDDELYCDNCNKKIEPAYDGED